MINQHGSTLHFPILILDGRNKAVNSGDTVPLYRLEWGDEQVDPRQLGNKPLCPPHWNEFFSHARFAIDEAYRTEIGDLANRAQASWSRPTPSVGLSGLNSVMAAVHVRAAFQYLIDCLWDVDSGRWKRGLMRHLLSSGLVLRFWQRQAEAAFALEQADLHELKAQRDEAARQVKVDAEEVAFVDNFLRDVKAVTDDAVFNAFYGATGTVDKGLGTHGLLPEVLAQVQPPLHATEVAVEPSQDPGQPLAGTPRLCACGKSFDGDGNCPACAPRTVTVSRSVHRRVAAMKGEPAPSFENPPSAGCREERHCLLGTAATVAVAEWGHLCFPTGRPILKTELESVYTTADGRKVVLKVPPSVRKSLSWLIENAGTGALVRMVHAGTYMLRCNMVSTMTDECALCGAGPLLTKGRKPYREIEAEEGPLRRVIGLTDLLGDGRPGNEYRLVLKDPAEETIQWYDLASLRPDAEATLRLATDTLLIGMQCPDKPLDIRLEQRENPDRHEVVLYQRQRGPFKVCADCMARHGTDHVAEAVTAKIRGGK